MLYVIWVIWLGNYWWILGLGVVFDLNVTKKVNWTFWNPRDKAKRNAFTEWVDAIIFALIVVTFINTFFFQAFKIPSSSMESSLMTGDHLFVSKLSYGPRIPQTPLTIPFTHNVIGSKESYSTLIQNDYRRLKGFGKVKRSDIVVFGFPNGDSVLVQAPGSDYYMVSRVMGRDAAIAQYGPVKARPMDKVDHYVKRCVAVAGDTLKIENGVLYVNGMPAPVYKGQQTSYTVVTSTVTYPELSMTAERAESLANQSNVVSVEANVDEYPADYPDSYLTIFPFSEDYRWTRDNYGPIWIPSAGSTVTLNPENLPLYERIISKYEGHDLKVEDGAILIDGQMAQSYTFAQDYYFMMGDNRHNSLDSRYWGFVPEDHIVGKPSIVWLSTDETKKFPNNIRWKRFLKVNFNK
ncbi:MAG: signal peptidase I [Bacteroidales bacterium]|nr:signal peptidase I [Bacteroidales bacterium]